MTIPLSLHGTDTLTSCATKNPLETMDERSDILPGYNPTMSPVAETTPTGNIVNESKPLTNRISRRRRKETCSKPTPPPRPRLTESEVKDRSLLIKGVIGGILAMVILIICVVFLLRPDASIAQADQDMRELEQRFDLARLASLTHRLDKAQQYLAETQRELAVQSVNEPIIMQRKASLQERCRVLKEDLDLAKNNELALADQRRILARFDHLSTCRSAEINAFEQEVHAFIARHSEPVPPAHLNLAKDLQCRLPEIDKARKTIIAHATADQVWQARIVINRKVREERYQEALDLLAAVVSACPQGDLSGQEDYIRNSAKMAWDGVTRLTDNCMSDLASIGMPEQQKKRSNLTIRRRLNEVTERFGIPEYVMMAKEQLGRLPDAGQQQVHATP